MVDNVNHPAHYTYGKREVIVYLEEILNGMGTKLTPIMAYDLGCALKYLFRHPFKEKPAEDLEKAKRYIGFLIEQYQQREATEVEVCRHE